MNKNLAQRIIEGYESNLWWVKILNQLDSNDALENNKIFLPFVQELSSTDTDLYFFPRPAAMVNNHGDKTIALPALRSQLIYHINHVSSVHCICIPTFVALEIIAIAYGKSHPGFARYYEIVSRFWYICGLTKLLQAFIRHYSQCLQLRTRKHHFYGSLQLIHSPPVPFHTFIFAFVLALPLSANSFNLLMSVTCKFSKRVILVEGKDIWSAKNWAYALLQRLNMIDWNPLSKLITDRDPKFLSKFWKALFTKLGVKLLYSIAYHLQTDGSSKRTNQTMEIPLRFFIHALEDLAK